MGRLPSVGTLHRPYWDTPGAPELLLCARPATGNVEFAGDKAVPDTWYRTFTFT